MKFEYERTNLIMTEFDKEDVITTSGIVPPDPTVVLEAERENAYGSFDSFQSKLPGTWF